MLYKHGYLINKVTSSLEKSFEFLQEIIAAIQISLLDLKLVFSGIPE